MRHVMDGHDSGMDLMRCVHAFALVLLTTTAARATPAEPPPGPTWDAGHATLTALSSLGGAAVGGVAGILVGGLSVSCDAFACVGAAIIGGAIGGTLGGGAGAWTYGTLRDFDGSFWAATGGFALGVLGGGLLSYGCVSIADGCSNVAPFLSLASGVAGATWGYYATLPRAQRLQRHGGLLDYDADGLRLGYATPLWLPGPDGEAAMGLVLGAGRF